MSGETRIPEVQQRRREVLIYEYVHIVTNSIFVPGLDNSSSSHLPETEEKA
jgi:hypothetical protein